MKSFPLLARAFILASPTESCVVTKCLSKYDFFIMGRYLLAALIFNFLGEQLYLEIAACGSQVAVC